MRFGFIFVIVSLMMLSTFVLSELPYYPKDKGQLEQEVKSILRRSNVDVRPDVEKVFVLGDIYFMEGNLEKAKYYFSEGLKVNSWNLPYQLKYAKILQSENQVEPAVEKAKLVYEYAEDEDLIEQSESLLAQLNHPVQKDVTSSPAGSVSIMLISIGDTNPYLLKEVAHDLQNILGVQYVINDDIRINPGKVDRPYAYRYVKRIYNDMKERLSDSEFKEYRTKAGTLITELDNYENQKKFILAVFEDNSTPEQLKEFQNSLRETESEGQYDTERLNRLLRSHVHQLDMDPFDGYIGITSRDIYSSDYNFLFGSAGLTYGVMSYHRFTAAFNDDPPNRPMLRKRMVKQCISSTFFTLGIERCTSPTCARAYPNDLTEHDRKSIELCNWCKQQLKKKLAQKK